jgi:putative transposase
VHLEARLEPQEEITDAYAGERPMFVTLVCHERRPLLATPEAKQLLLSVMHKTKTRLGIAVVGYTILDDHMHWLFAARKLTCNSVVNDLRAQFARSLRTLNPELREAPLWKSPFCMRELHGPDDLRDHLDFIHYDPARHGLVTCPAEYRWSSLPARIRHGRYPENWGCAGPPSTLYRLLPEYSQDRNGIGR